jgi:hypothetical protein
MMVIVQATGKAKGKSRSLRDDNKKSNSNCKSNRGEVFVYSLLTEGVVL